MWAGRPTRDACGGSLGPCRPARAGPYVRLMKITFTKAPTFTKTIIASAIFTIVYLASPASDYMTGQALILDGGFLSW